MKWIIPFFVVCSCAALCAQDDQALVKARTQFAEAEKEFKIAEAAFFRAKANYSMTIDKSRKSVAPKTLEVHEKILDATSPAKIEIVSVKYGYGTELSDVTQVVQRLFAQTKRISANGAELRVPDPAFGKVKTLYVELRVNGAKTLLVLPEGGEVKF